MLDPFTWGKFHPPMVPQLWKLPKKFRGSMVLFMLFLALGNAKPVVGMVLLLSAAYGCFHFTRWDALLFVCGVILAELQILRKSSPCTLERLRRNSTLVNAIRLIPAIFWVAVLAPRSLRRFLACKPSMPIPPASNTSANTLLHNATQPCLNIISRSRSLQSSSYSLGEFRTSPKTLCRSTCKLFRGIYRSGYTLSMFHFLKRLGDGSCHNYSLLRQPQLWHQEFPRGFFLGSILITPFIVWSAGYTLDTL